MATMLRTKRKCEICGKVLIMEYYYTGRCRLHQTTKDFDAKISADVAAAERKGLSYVQYMAIKHKEG